MTRKLHCGDVRSAGLAPFCAFARDAGHIAKFAEGCPNEYAVACVDRASGGFISMKLSFGALTIGALIGVYKKETAAVCVTAIVAAMALPASAHVGSVDVINQSDACAWVTVYSSYGTLDTWTILAGSNSSPRFVKPGEKWSMGTTSGTNEVKILAEVTKQADCKGGTVGTPYDTFKYPDGDITRVDGFIKKADGRYWVTIPSYRRR
jgi:hypothetical protein